MLEDICKLMCGSFPDDLSKPGVVVALLDDDIWYASAVRYAGKFGEGKYVVTSARGGPLEDVLATLLEQLTCLVRPSSV